MNDPELSPMDYHKWRNSYKYSDKWTKLGRPTYVGMQLTNNWEYFQLHRFITDKKIAKSFRGCFFGSPSFSSLRNACDGCKYRPILLNKVWKVKFYRRRCWSSTEQAIRDSADNCHVTSSWERLGGKRIWLDLVCLVCSRRMSMRRWTNVEEHR